MIIVLGMILIFLDFIDILALAYHSQSRAGRALWKVKQSINNNNRANLPRTACDLNHSGRQDREGGGGVNAFNCHKIFALDYVVVKTQKLLANMKAS